MSSFRSRRGYSTARPSSLYGRSSALTSTSRPSATSSSLLGRGLSQSTPFLSGGGGGGLQQYSVGSGYGSSGYSSTLSPYSSYQRTPSSSVQRSVSPSYHRTVATGHRPATARSFSVSRYPSSGASSSSSRTTRSRSSSEGYVSGGEKERERDAGSSSGSGAASSRLGQAATGDIDQQPTRRHHVDDSESTAAENGELDYKKLYEESQADNQRLREKLKKTEDDLTRSKLMSDKVPYVPMRNSLSEAEKREKKAMERKLSEMEEELKQLEQLKCENQKLKDENGALIRVISKLSK